jgi:hypothetical protein
MRLLLRFEVGPPKLRLMDETPGLPTDPRRQANAMLAGCEYQVWQTVSAWLDLRANETLFVEGAEDFDARDQ